VQLAEHRKPAFTATSGAACLRGITTASRSAA